MSAEGGAGAVRALRGLFSLALIAVAGWVVFKGVQFARMGTVEWRIERERADSRNAPVPAEAAEQGEALARRDEVAQWRDAWGLRDEARLLYFGIGQRQLDPPSPQGLQELAALIRVDPVRATSWMDLAQMTWDDLSMRPVSLAAWEMSGLTGPYEYADMLRRTHFLAHRWIFAGEEQKQRFVYEVVLMGRFPDPFASSWSTLLKSLPARQRERLQAEMEAVSPLYRR